MLLKRQLYTQLQFSYIDHVVKDGGKHPPPPPPHLLSIVPTLCGDLTARKWRGIKVVIHCD